VAADEGPSKYALPQRVKVKFVSESFIVIGAKLCKC
jgi:hypothetical protein